MVKIEDAASDAVLFATGDLKSADFWKLEREENLRPASPQIY